MIFGSTYNVMCPSSSSVSTRGRMRAAPGTSNKQTGSHRRKERVRVSCTHYAGGHTHIYTHTRWGVTHYPRALAPSPPAHVRGRGAPRAAPATSAHSSSSSHLDSFPPGAAAAAALGSAPHTAAGASAPYTTRYRARTYPCHTRVSRHHRRGVVREGHDGAVRAEYLAHDTRELVHEVSRRHPGGARVIARVLLSGGWRAPQLNSGGNEHTACARICGGWEVCG